MHNTLQPLSQLTSAACREIEYFFTDVDDTITNEGKLRVEALQALWALKASGIKTILVTGGSAGWADIYIRQWPVDAVITESGALAYYMVDGVKHTLYNPLIDRMNYKDRVDTLVEEVKKEVPESKLSSDQFCRIFDVAFDHHGEKPWLSAAAAERIAVVARSHGAQVGISSIHVNCWFGAYHKLSMVSYFMEQVYGLKGEDLIKKGCYCGDAPNDAELFHFFPKSFGVGNIRKHVGSIMYEPTYCAVGEGGIGFAEIVHQILRLR